MVNDSHYPIPQLEENKKLYTARDINRVDCARKLQNITVQPIKQTLHSVDNKILHNLSIFWEDVGMDEDIYGPSVPYFQGKIVCHNIKHVEPMMVPNVPNDLFQPKTDLFSTRALIWVHFKTVRYFSQPNFRLFSYLKNA